MKQLEHQILVKQAQIACLRFLRSGAASPGLAQVASLEEMDRTAELEKLQKLQTQQGELALVNVVHDDDTPLAVNFSKQPPKPAEGAK